MRVYVAGPYTSDPGSNVHAAIIAAQRLVENGHTPFVPHLYHLWHLIIPGSYEQWIALDLDWLRTCKALIRLPGESSGADREVAFALELGITVYFGIHDFLLKNADEKFPAPPAPEKINIPVQGLDGDVGLRSLQAILNKIIFSLGSDLTALRNRVCRVCRKPWDDHSQGETWACPEVMKLLERENG